MGVLTIKRMRSGIIKVYYLFSFSASVYIYNVLENSLDVSVSVCLSISVCLSVCLCHPSDNFKTRSFYSILAHFLFQQFTI